MKYHLVSGGCGLVGRNMVKRLVQTTSDTVFIVDDLSTGIHPSRWFPSYTMRRLGEVEIIGTEERVYFLKEDFRDFLFRFRHEPDFIDKKMDS
jgi:nucleoside-diphosphate-sugar epimerase